MPNGSIPHLPVSRRRFLQVSGALGLASIGFPAVAQSSQSILGQGDFRYRIVPNWGVLGPDTPVKNCHGIVCDREGHIVLLTDHVSNNVIIYDKNGKLVHKWGTEFPGAHGLSLVKEGDREVLFITDLQTHRVVKTTLDGQKLQEWRWPEATGKYTQEADYRPSWTLHLEDGSFFILDGYGRDFITHHGPDGEFLKIFGGAEGGISHWGPHGGMVDRLADGTSTLLIAMSDQQHLLRLSVDGKPLQKIELPGGNPRQIRAHQGYYVLAHLADNWPKDRNSRAFLSILDSQLHVISNVGGSAPRTSDNGTLQPMSHEGDTFIHPHDVVADSEHSLYVAQFASGQTYPIKLERI